jgi:hypothetical protein
MPAAALIPEVMPKPIASGRATIATVTPAIASSSSSRLLLGKSDFVGNRMIEQGYYFMNPN